MNYVFAWPVGRALNGQPIVHLVRVGLFGLGALVGGVVLGLLINGLSRLADVLQQDLLFFLPAIVAVAAQGLGVTYLWPQARRQVDRTVLIRRPRLAPVQFGIELGIGMRTWNPQPAFAALVLLSALIEQPALHLAAGLAFGGMRGITPLAHQLFVQEERTAVRVGKLLGGRGWRNGFRHANTVLALIVLYGVAPDIGPVFYRGGVR